MTEALELLWGFNRSFPLTLVSTHNTSHVIFKLTTDIQLVIDNDFTQIVETTFKVFQPYRCTLQAICCTYIEHQYAVDIFDQGFIVQICRKQISMTRSHTTITADIQIPTAFSRNDTNVF